MHDHHSHPHARARARVCVCVRARGDVFVALRRAPLNESSPGLPANAPLFSNLFRNYWATLLSIPVAYTEARITPSNRSRTRQLSSGFGAFDVVVGTLLGVNVSDDTIRCARLHLRVASSVPVLSLSALSV